MKKDHPLGTFSCGNLESLKTNLEAKNSSAFKYLHEWYPRNYSSKWMYLTVQSIHDLDLVQNWIEEIFTPIPRIVSANDSYGFIIASCLFRLSVVGTRC